MKTANRKNAKGVIDRNNVERTRAEIVGLLEVLFSVGAYSGSFIDLIMYHITFHDEWISVMTYLDIDGRQSYGEFELVPQAHSGGEPMTDEVQQQAIEYLRTLSELPSIARYFKGEYFLVEAPGLSLADGYTKIGDIPAVR